ncbi:hypothetical protein QUW15_12420 [Desulfovibrio piger]|nr:hypothetical protein [Desulfovibrio piger]
MSFSPLNGFRPGNNSPESIPATVSPDFRQHLYEAQDVAHFLAESLELMTQYYGPARAFPSDSMSGAITCLRYLKGGLVALGDEISTDDD